LSPVAVREAFQQETPGGGRRVRLDLEDAEREAEAGHFERRAASRDVLDLLLLHGDCAFLLDLQEL